MPERRQSAAQHFLPDAISTLVGRKCFELLDEIRHIVNRAEVSRAVERHLRCDEKV